MISVDTTSSCVMPQGAIVRTQDSLPYREILMYTKKCYELQLAGNHSKIDYDVRFSAKDHRVVVADMLVAFEAYQDVGRAQRWLNMLYDTNSEKIHGLESLINDTNLQSGTYKVRSVHILYLIVFDYNII